MTSIDHKQCPSCAARNPAGALRCACGYAWTSGDNDSLADIQNAIGESQTVEEYLVARVDQALAVVESTRSELAADPRNFKKAARLLRAAQEARALGDELNTQREYTHSLQQTLGTESPESPPAGPVQTERPGERFTAQQASRAQQIAARFEGTETKTCPQCGTVLPVSSLLCFCSYRFPLATEQAASGLESPSRHDPKSYS
jgi:hypothetical protein